MTEPDYTPASRWSSTRLRGVLCTLPSGNKARLRRTLSIMHALEAGSLPNPLHEYVVKLLKGGGEEKSMEAMLAEHKGEFVLELADVDETALVSLIKLIDQEIPTIFISPLVEVPPEDESNRVDWKPTDPEAISIIDLTWEDKMFAYNFAQGGPAQLESFPDATKNMANSGHGRGVSPATSGAVTDR